MADDGLPHYHHPAGDAMPDAETPDRGPQPPAAAASDVPVCDLCGTIMLERHCRMICMQCGYQRDCSDP